MVHLKKKVGPTLYPRLGKASRSVSSAPPKSETSFFGRMSKASQVATVSGGKDPSPDHYLLAIVSMNSFLPERADTGRYERSPSVNTSLPTRTIASIRISTTHARPKNYWRGF